MIESENLNIWPLERHDLMKNYQWANNNCVCSFAGANPLPKSSSEVESWFQNTAQDPEVYVFAMKTKDGNYIGNIELRNLDLRCGNAEVGIIIGEKEAWGKGYGTEAVKALCAFAFDELRLHRLYVRVLSTNPRALRMFEKCGFVMEGCEKEAFYQKGEYLDVNILGLLSTKAN